MSFVGACVVISEVMWNLHCCKTRVSKLLALQVYQWTSDGRADLYYSFYLVVLATVLFGVNIILVFCSGVDCKPVRYRTNINEKALDGVMMY